MAYTDIYNREGIGVILKYECTLYIMFQKPRRRNTLPLHLVYDTVPIGTPYNNSFRQICMRLIFYFYRLRFVQTDHDPRNPAYIATQGPLAETSADFWQMVWEQGCVVIVMLTRLVENDVVLCHRYWPEEGSELYHIYEVNF